MNFVDLGKTLLDQKAEVDEITLNDNTFKLSPTQKEFINNFKDRFCLYSGGYGCVDGKTKIYDADNKKEIPIEVLYKKKKAIKVLSIKNGRIVKSQATIPVKYLKAPLYKLKTDKREIIATAKHRFLTENGFKKLSDLSVGEQLLEVSPSLLQSNSESYQSILSLNVFHLFEKGLSFLSYCRSLFRLCDEQLPYPTTKIREIQYYKTDNYYDIHVFGTHNYLAEGLFHHNSGKSLALYIKLILFVKCFPGNKVVLGRKTLQDIERAILPDLFDLMPRTWYKHRVKDAVINIHNGSQIIMFGLDSLQQGSMADIKKAQQKLKSINIGAFFIDQLEEIEYEVFNTLDTRMRRLVPVRQGNMTTNPANFWAYDWFKANPRINTKLYEGSMLDNKDNLPDDYIEAQLQKDERFVRRYVYGEWTPDILTDKAVFAPEFIRKFELKKKTPKMEENCEIYEEPKHQYYQMGVDPSEGIVDPSSISVVSEQGKKVAKFNGKTTIPGLIEKVRFLYYKYRKSLIIPEANASGAALIEGIKDLKVYRRKQFEYRTKIETEKLGFKTSHQSKQALIAHFIDLLRQGFCDIQDDKTIQEMKTFIWSDEARQQGAGAQRGFHDDDIMSTMLAYWNLSPKRVDILKAKRSKEYNKREFQYI